VKQGDTFFYAPAGQQSHLYAIISDPTNDADRLVAVNFSKWREYGDPACIVQAGFHSFITEKSYVHYAGAKCFSSDFLVRWSKPSDPLIDAHIDLLLDGAETSERLPLDIRQILVSQDLIADD
jgi:hypothetical protein